MQGGVKVALNGQWHKLTGVHWSGNRRHRHLGRVTYGASAPRRVWLTMSRARDHQGLWGIWDLGSHRPRRAHQMATAYGDRCCCAEGCRDAKWDLSVAQAWITAIRAWARLFALLAIALLVLTHLGLHVLRRGKLQAHQLWRRVASRRRARGERCLIAAVIALVQHDRNVCGALAACTKLN